MSPASGDPMTDLEIRVVRSGVRPHRVAILVPSGGGALEWLEVIDVRSQIWGGSYCVAVPTDGDTILPPFWQLLDIYDPDIVVRLKQISLGANISRDIPTRINPYPTRGGDRERYHCSPIWPDNIPYPLAKVSAVADPNSFGGCKTPVVVATPTVELLAYAYLGRLTSHTGEEPKENRIAFGEADFDLQKNPNRSGDLWNLAWEDTAARNLDELGKLPRDLTRVHLGAYHDAGTNWYRAPVVLVVGQSTEDFCLFYSLSHMRPYVFWLPTELLDAVPAQGNLPLDDVSVSALFHLANQIQNLLKYRSDDRDFLVISMSCDTQQIGAALGTLERTRLIKTLDKTLPEAARVETRVDELLRCRYRPWELNNNLGTTPHSIQILTGESVGYIDVRPKHLSWDFTKQPNWVSEIAVDRYQLPRRSELNDKAVSFDGFAPDARVTSDGIAFNGVKPMVMAGTDIDVVLARPKLKIMNPLGIVAPMLAEAGFEFELSDKGSYQERTLARFGGIDAFVDEYSSPRWRIVSKFLDQSPNRPDVHDQGMRIRDRRYLDAASIATQLHRGKDDQPVREAIEDYLEKGILQRGFALKCLECKQTDWYGVAEVGEQFQCSRCGVLQRYDPEVNWMYRLSEVVFQCLSNHVHVHILTLAAIERWAKRGSFMYVPSINVFAEKDCNTPFSEVDIICVVDGKLVLGECKTTGSLSKEDRHQVAKYQDLASKLKPDVLVFSTLANEWSQAATKLFAGRAKHLRQYGVEVRLLSAKDLTPTEVEG